MKALDRLEVIAGVKPEIEESRGISDDTWDGMSSAEKRKYVKDHPTSRFAEKDTKHRIIKKSTDKKVPKIRPLKGYESEIVDMFKTGNFNYDNSTWSKAFDMVEDILDKNLRNGDEVEDYFLEHFDSLHPDEDLFDTVSLLLLHEGQDNILHYLPIDPTEKVDTFIHEVIGPTRNVSFKNKRGNGAVRAPYDAKIMEKLKEYKYRDFEDKKHKRKHR